MAKPGAPGFHAPSPAHQFCVFLSPVKKQALENIPVFPPGVGGAVVLRDKLQFGIGFRHVDTAKMQMGHRQGPFSRLPLRVTLGGARQGHCGRQTQGPNQLPSVHGSMTPFP